MNKLNVHLNDYFVGFGFVISYLEKDIEAVESTWDKPENPDLIRLHSVSSLRGFERWCDLSPGHYRILITHALKMLSRLNEVERTDARNPIVAALNFIILAFIKCIEERTESNIEHFRINRLDDLNITFDYSGSYNINYEMPQPKEAEFSIIMVEE